MKPRIIFILCCMMLAVLPAAQALEIEFSTNAYTFNNSDLNNYSHKKFAENKSAEYLNTDDRMSFAYANIALDYSRKYKDTEFFISFSRWGFWGSDNLEGRDDGKNPITFSKLYFKWYPVRDFTFQFGRYQFKIGNAERDYFLSDTNDGMLVAINFSKDISLQAEFDVLGIGAKPDDTRVWFGIAKDSEIMKGFDGDVLSLRGGLIGDIYFVKLFSFFLRYGANSEGGADIAENGKSTVNQADGDFLLMNGIRLNYDFSRWGKTDFTFAYSYGKDYQYDRDRTYNGFGVALNHNAKIPTKYFTKAGVSAGYFQPDFSSMKSESMAGTLLWAYKSYFACPYTYFYHFRDFQKRDWGQTTIDRTISKTFARFDLDFHFWKIDLTYNTLILFANDRAPVYMGWENEINVSLPVDPLTFSIMAAVFLPGGWYNDSHTDNTYIPHGSDPFYGFGFSISYKLSWN